MPLEKIVCIEDIGEVSLKRDKRFKRLSIRMAPNKGIWINLPHRVSLKEGIQFAMANKNWILRNKQKKEQKEQQQTVFDQQTQFRTRYHQLKLFPSEVNEFSAQLQENILEIKYPRQLKTENKQLQNFIKNSIVETLRREANHYLPKRLDFLAAKHKFSYQSLSIKNTKNRWGSCSHDNKINLCLHLMRLPEELSDMVILHELCHTKVKNHSAEFWSLLAKHCPNLEQKRKQIKNYSTEIF